MRRIIFGVGFCILLVCAMTLVGCPIRDVAENYTFSNGTMKGINGYEGIIAADINVTPNTGGKGTPVEVEVRFTMGGSM